MQSKMLKCKNINERTSLNCVSRFYAAMIQLETVSDELAVTVVGIITKYDYQSLEFNAGDVVRGYLMMINAGLSFELHA